MTTMRSRRLASVLLALVGIIWIGQGLGLLRGSSFMVDDIRWAIAGAAMVATGLTIVILGRRSSA